jgi:hypothetical protein
VRPEKFSPRARWEFTQGAGDGVLVGWSLLNRSEENRVATKGIVEAAAVLVYLLAAVLSSNKKLVQRG